GRQDRPGRHLRPRVPAAPRAADRGHRASARGGQGGCPAGVRAAERGLLSETTTDAPAASPFGGVPGVVDVVDAHHETTVVVEPGLLVDAALHLRDELGFNFLSDVTAVDYLGWGDAGVSGYIGTRQGRDLNAPSTQGYQALPQPKPKRFAMNYHLLKLARLPQRVRL